MARPSRNPYSKMVALFSAQIDRAEDFSDTESLKISLQCAHLPLRYAVRVLSHIEARERSLRATPESPVPKTDYEETIAAYPESDEALPRFLTRLRRALAGDGPHDREPGTLEAFDAACDALGVPFLEP